jgi:molybdopterin-guanine dinucleotide biosynthesis adapter protein
LRSAGAGQVLIASDRWRALITEYTAPREPELQGLVNALDLDMVDLVLVEGFRHVPFPKIEPHRPSLGHPPPCRGDRGILAVASVAPVDRAGLPRLDINQGPDIAEFIRAWARRAPR